MLLVSTNSITGREYDVLGLVTGVGVPPFKLRFSTEQIGKVIEEGVERANNSMIAKAQAMGADAIVRVRYDKEASETGVQIMVWGTAVRLR
ncbi:MAG: heavy metal-binding domain-containing protein [Oscillospiraceae bacterium]|nr:heavy metal-binding domain-containing protein [Oscillospiraceae bacterium]